MASYKEIYAKIYGETPDCANCPTTDCPDNPNYEEESKDA